MFNSLKNTNPKKLAQNSISRLFSQSFEYGTVKSKLKVLNECFRRLDEPQK